MSQVVLALAALAPAAARADECDQLAAAVVAGTGASADPRGMYTIKMHHPGVESLSVDCPMATADTTSFSVSWDGAYPPNKFYDLVGTAGNIVMGAPVKNVASSARKCQRRALGSKDEMAEVNENELHVECQAFSRGGGGTAISIYRAAGKK